MNCETQVYSRQELLEIASLQEKEAKIQLLDDVLKLMNTGMTIPMIRVRVYNMLIKVKGEGEKA